MPVFIEPVRSPKGFFRTFGEVPKFVFSTIIMIFSYCSRYPTANQQKGPNARGRNDPGNWPSKSDKRKK